MQKEIIALCVLLASVSLLSAEERIDTLKHAPSGIAVTIDAAKLDEQVPKKDTENVHVNKTAEEIAAELRNPATPMATIKTKWEYRSYTGTLPDADNQSGTNVLLQPVFPLPMGEGEIIAIRPALPIYFSTPYFDANENTFSSSRTSIGDVGFDLMYGKHFKSGVIALGGLVGTLPWASDDAVSANQYRMGAESLVGYIQPWGFLGLLVSHQWDIGGYGSNDSDYSTTEVNYIYALSLGKGWQVSSGPIASYDWEAEAGNRWSVPVGIGIYKTTKFGNMPWKIGFEVQKYVVKKDAFSPDWMFQIVIAPVVKNPLANLFN